MSNEDIRYNYDKKWFSDAESIEDDSYIVDMFDEIQDLTRKDERDKVMVEIKDDMELHLTRCESEDYNMAVDFVIEYLTTKLNELRAK